MASVKRPAHAQHHEDGGGKRPRSAMGRGGGPSSQPREQLQLPKGMVLLSRFVSTLEEQRAVTALALELGASSRGGFGAPATNEKTVSSLHADGFAPSTPPPAHHPTGWYHLLETDEDDAFGQEG